MNPMFVNEVGAAHLSDLHRQAEARTLVTRARRERREAIAGELGVGAPTHSARSAVGWWLVGTGLRLAGRDRGSLRGEFSGC
jgi:hypothetical protein